VKINVSTWQTVFTLVWERNKILTLQKIERKKRENGGGGGYSGSTKFKRNRNTFPPSKVPRQCSLVLPIEIFLGEGKVLEN
jgi:hypothetical protein